MSTVKTAVSIEQELFDWVEQTADHDGVSRSSIFSQALLTLRRVRESERLLNEYNTFYGKYGVSEEDKVVLPAVNRSASRILKADDW